MAAAPELDLENTQIKAGDLIFKEKPFVYALKYKYRTERCDLCFKKSNSLSQCSACHYVHYCDKVCQKAGWKMHKFECKNLSRVSPAILPDYGRMLLRLFRLLQKGDGHQRKSYYTKTAFRMYKDLMSHHSSIRKDAGRMEDFNKILFVLQIIFIGEYLPSSDDLLEMYGRICTNGFSILSETMNILGYGIYLGASVIDHSCMPNVGATFDGVTLCIKALKDIDSLDWSRVYISYIDTMNTTEDRQKDLLSMYYFSCECERCLQPELPEMLAAACPNSTCDHYIDMQQQTERCTKCSAVVSAEFIKRFLEVDKLTDMYLKQIDKGTLDYKACVACLRRQRGVLHKFNIKHFKMLDHVFRCSFEMSNWEDAFKYGNTLMGAYDKYAVDCLPPTGLLGSIMNKLPSYIPPPTKE